MNTDKPPQALLTAVAVAEELGVPLQTLYGWRSAGKGPRGIRVGRYLRYRRADVDAWLEKQADPIPDA